MNEIKQKSYYDFAVKLFIVIGLVAVLFTARQVVIPLTIAIFLSFLIHPLSKKFEKIRIPRAPAIIISILIALICFAALLYFLIVQFTSFSEDLPELKKQVNEKAAQAGAYIEQRFRFTRQEQLSWIKTQMKQTSNAGPAMILGVFSATGTFIAMLALIPIYTFFIVYLRDKYKQFVLLIAKERSDKWTTIVRDVSSVSRKYLRGVMIDVTILSVLGSVGYLLLGIKHAILFGVLAAVLNIVPYVGVMVGSLLPVMMALITKDDVSYAFGAVGVAVLVQFIDNNFIYPFVVGSSVSLNPLTALVVLIIGAMIWGIIGMILAIPLAGVIKVICDHIEVLRPYGFLIGEEVDYRTGSRFYKYYERRRNQKDPNTPKTDHT